MLVEQIEWKISNGQESIGTQLDYMQNLAVSLGEQVHNSAALQGQLRKDEDDNKLNIEKAKEALANLNSAADDMEQKIESVHKDSITILGIFASIVLSFTAGIVYSTSVFENVHKASPYRIVGVTLLLGFVLTNVLTILLLYINSVRMVKPGAIQYPKSVKLLNFLYIAGFIANFALWLILEKLALWNTC